MNVDRTAHAPAYDVRRLLAPGPFTGPVRHVYQRRNGAERSEVLAGRVVTEIGCDVRIDFVPGGGREERVPSPAADGDRADHPVGRARTADALRGPRQGLGDALHEGVEPFRPRQRPDA